MWLVLFFSECDDASIHKFVYVEVAFDHTGMFEATEKTKAYALQVMVVEDER